jgi:hypothetical protein
MIPFIYHGKTSFGMKTSGQSFYTRTFLYGQRAQALTFKRSPFTVSNYILDALPKQKLYGKEMNSYEKYGDLERVTYEDGMVVEVNTRTDKYSVTLGNGLVIAKDYTSFAPVKDNVFLACSKKGGIINYRIPDRWENTEKVKVYTIKEDGKLEQVKFVLNDRYLEFNTDPNVPYKVIYK